MGEKRRDEEVFVTRRGGYKSDEYIPCVRKVQDHVQQLAPLRDDELNQHTGCVLDSLSADKGRDHGHRWRRNGILTERRCFRSVG